jgi:hypothetical protein
VDFVTELEVIEIVVDTELEADKLEVEDDEIVLETFGFGNP